MPILREDTQLSLLVFFILLKTRQTRFPRQKLLHGGQLDVALFGYEAFLRIQQGVHIRQGGGNGVLFGERGG